MRTTNYSRTTHGIRRCTSRRSGGCGLPALASTIEPQPWRMAPTSSGSGLGITANTTDSLAVSNRNETPNHALQRTAPRVTVAAFHVRSRLVRARRCLTSVASFFAPPSQLPRHAPPSLSLGSLGVTAPLFSNGAFPKSFPSLMTYPEFHGFLSRSERHFPARSGALSVRCS